MRTGLGGRRKGKAAAAVTVGPPPFLADWVLWVALSLLLIATAVRTTSVSPGVNNSSTILNRPSPYQPGHDGQRSPLDSSEGSGGGGGGGSTLSYNATEREGNRSATTFEQSAKPCCDSNSTDRAQTASPSARTHRVVIEFSTKIVQNEYIVQFNGYYKPKERESFIQSALNGSKVRSMAYSNSCTCCPN